MILASAQHESVTLHWDFKQMEVVRKWVLLLFLSLKKILQLLSFIEICFVCKEFMRTKYFY